MLLLLWFFSVLWSNSFVCVLYVSKLLTSTSTVQIHLNLLNCIDSPQANIIKSVLNLFCTERHFNFYSFKSHANIIQISKVICLFVFILQFNSMFGRDILPMQKKATTTTYTCAPIKRCAILETKLFNMFQLYDIY